MTDRQAGEPRSDDVLSRLDGAIEKLEQVRIELRSIREWAEMVQRSSEGTNGG